MQPRGHLAGCFVRSCHFRLREWRLVVDIRLDEAVSLFQRWVLARIAGMWRERVVVVVCPFREVICKLQTGKIGSCVFEVDDNQLLVLICWLEQRRLFIIGADSQDISVLSLQTLVSAGIIVWSTGGLHHCGQTRASP